MEKDVLLGTKILVESYFTTSGNRVAYFSYVTLAGTILKIAAKTNMGTETGGRFVNISDEEVTQFCEEQENDNTK